MAMEPPIVALRGCAIAERLGFCGIVTAFRHRADIQDKIIHAQQTDNYLNT